MKAEPKTLFEQLDASLLTEKPRDNRFNPVASYPQNRAYVVRQESASCGDVMGWDEMCSAASVLDL